MFGALSRSEWLWVAGIALAGGAAVVALGEEFRRILGRAPWALAYVVAVVAGGVAVGVLRDHDWGYEPTQFVSWAGVAVAAGAALLFTVSAIVADWRIGFEEDLNVDWPAAFGFYPVVALLAEAVFHLIPLAVLAALFAPDGGLDSVGARVVVFALVVASLEPLFQVLAGSSDPARLQVFVAVHVFVFGAAQIAVFWRFGLAATVSLRLVYYLTWHIAWGRLRLDVLF